MLLTVLLLLTADAGSFCPLGPDSIILEPPEIFGEYGEWVTVNCSSTQEHGGIYWRDQQGNSELERDLKFTMWSAPLNWSSHAQCRVGTSGGECSRDLLITVYKPPDAVQLYPLTHSAGHTHYTLQCDVPEVAPVRNLVVSWYRDDLLVQSHAFNGTASEPQSQSAALTVSRSDSGARIRCDAHLVFGPDGPQLPAVSSEVYTVSVQYAPEFRNKDVDELLRTVEEGENVTLSCEADGNPPPAFTWVRNGENLQENSSILHVPQVLSSATYRCQAANTHGNIFKQMQVTVLKTKTPEPVGVGTTPTVSSPLPRGCPLTLTPPEVAVKFGGPTEVMCRAEDQVSILGWKATHASNQQLGVSSISWSVDVLQDWNVNASCFMQTDNLRCAVLLPITVYQPPEKVMVSWRAGGAMVEGDTYNLTCDITNVAPIGRLKVSWLENDDLVKVQQFEDGGVEPQNISSVLVLKPSRHMVLRCIAELELRMAGAEGLRVTSDLFHPVVHYPPQISCPPTLTAQESSTLQEVSCRADGNPPPTLHWYHQGQEVNASQPLNRMQAGQYQLVAANSIGNASTRLNVTVEYAPSLWCDDVYRVEENSEVWPSCNVSGVPPPVITWSWSGRRLTRWDSGEYNITAINREGRAARTVRLDVLYPPTFAQRDLALDASPGDNLTLLCSAEGNPAPSTSWTYNSNSNVREASWGLTITEATPTNAGVYTCIANNTVGRATRTLTLRVRSGETITAALGLRIAVILVPALLLLLVLLLAFICTRRKKHRRYSLVANNIPLNTTTGGRRGGA